MPKADQISSMILSRLANYGAYIYHRATTGSIYIKFPHYGLGSIRIGDHKGREKYRYRWRIRIDRDSTYFNIYRDRGIIAREYGPGNLEHFIADFIKSANDRDISPGDIASYTGDSHAH